MDIGTTIGCVGFGTQFVCSFFLTYPPGPLAWTRSPARPVLTRYTGKLIFLTVQTNLLGVVYYGLRAYASMKSFPQLKTCLGGLFPATFALGAFLTSGYYALDHFNPEGVKLRNRIAEMGYPAIHVLAHLEHCFALPVVLTDALTGSVPSAAGAPLNGLLALGGYVGYYTVLTHVNKYATGEWPYAIIDDVEAKAGTPGRCAFFVALTGVSLALGMLGQALAS